MTKQLSNRGIAALMLLDLKQSSDDASAVNELEQLGLSARAWSNYHIAHSKITDKGQTLANRIREVTRDA